MTSPDGTEELWEDVAMFNPELAARLSELGDIATGLHIWLYGSGGDWNGTGDIIA